MTDSIVSGLIYKNKCQNTTGIKIFGIDDGGSLHYDGDSINRLWQDAFISIEKLLRIRESNYHGG